MSKNIVKIVYDDETEVSVKDFKTLEQIKKDYVYDEEWRYVRHYERQFTEIVNSILEGLDDDLVKKYAKDNLDLKDENENDCDCEDKGVSDFEDNELMAELSSRNLFGYTNINIISIDQFTRLSRLITVADNRELEMIISDLEKKYNL